jgi:sugar phosphate isomerase/epimerase
MPQLSITTDYLESKGSPDRYLRAIGEAGFTHIHWCHQWNTDFLYGAAEIAQIKQWLTDYGIALCDLHASHGKEKRWGSGLDYERLAGLDLIRNRLDMTAELGGDVIILHAPPSDDIDRQRKSLGDLEADCRRTGVRIALENLGAGSFDRVEALLSEFGPDVCGHCYDCGHGNITGDGLARLEGLKDRLISVHLHDNDGKGDLHRIPFSDTVDWPRLAELIAGSSYTKPLSFEVVTRNHEGIEETEFLAWVLETGNRLAALVKGSRTRIAKKHTED